MNFWTIVPVKPLNRAKSRLAGILTPEQREALSAEMFRNTLDTLNKVQGLRGVLVISRDPKALALARGRGVQTVMEAGAPELNASLTRATQVVMAWNAIGVLVVPSDIPFLRAEDIEAMINLAISDLNCAVIAPDRRREGTNVLLLRPPHLIPYQYGRNSFALHAQAARQVGAAVHVYESDMLALDIDVPQDLELYRTLQTQLSRNAPASVGL
ncbi:MAG: 2-phospho-L-lactate guanylyltransferase [Anaerolineae bacterium]|nr:2-phospho-L-lactate guanylyltransferase [Anaerolineae bacterium]